MTQLFKKLPWLPCLAALAIGCGAPDLASDQPTLVAQKRNEIIGGTVNMGDPSIVAVYAIKPGAMSGALCTGAVIAPTVVLTAAHCVHPGTVGTGLDFFVLTAYDITDPTRPSPRLTVKETHYDPAFNPRDVFNGHDIAVVILNTPTTLLPIPWNEDPLPPEQTGQAVRLVGYGLNNSFGQIGSGIKRQVTAKLNSFDDKFVKTGDLIPWRGICSGDSGGPVLQKIGAVEKIIGVNSFGILFCVFESSSTRIDSYKSFVKTYVP